MKFLYTHIYDIILPTPATIVSIMSLRHSMRTVNQLQDLFLSDIGAFFPISAAEFYLG